MIHINNMSLSFSDTVIFDQASLAIHWGNRIGICGPNGTGKTTLFNCIVGRLEINAGSISIESGKRIAYFEQQGIELGATTIREELERAYLPYLALQDEIKTQEGFLASHSSDLKKMQKTIDRLELLHQKLQEVNYDNREADMLRVLKGLGFDPDDLDRAGGEFSGGWQMKIGLARILLSNPDILLLDEPTNHLDLDTRMWLIDTINNLKCTLLLISHDRYFLDSTISSIVELSQGKLNLFSGNYSDYEVQIKNNAILQEKHRRQYLEEVARQEAFIERFRYKATKARQVQSRIKALEKLEEKFTEGSKGLVDLSKQAEIRLHFPLSRKSSEHILELNNINKSYDGIPALHNINLSISRGEKIALIGPNGIGKSTLMRILAGQDRDYEGTLQWGAHAHCSYFSQRAADLLQADDTIWDFILDIESPFNDLARRSLLGAYLFTDETIFKKIGMLSGGEKSRVLLCSLALQPCNFLILDEPSNHLDLATQSLLLRALIEFEGTVVFSTHDRYMLEHLATKIVVLEKPSGDKGKLKKSQLNISTQTLNSAARSTVYLGNYEYYLWKKSSSNSSPAQDKNLDLHKTGSVKNPMATGLVSPRVGNLNTGNPNAGTLNAGNISAGNFNADITSIGKQNDYLLQKEKNALLRKLEKEELNLVTKIDKAEETLKLLKEKFSEKEIYTNAQKITALKQEISANEEDLEKFHTRWDQVHKEIEGLKTDEIK